MHVFTIPDALLGKDKDSANIIFYLREKGPDQIKLKLNYAQNMICFMLKGRKELIDGTKHYSMNHEQIGLVPSGNMLMNERVTLKEEFESLLLFFSNEFLAEFLRKYEINVEIKDYDQPPVLVFPKDEYLVTFQRSMKILEHDFKKRTFRIAKLEEILLYLLEKHPGQTRGFISSSILKNQHNPLTEVIQNHKYDNLSSEELAFLCNMSLSTFKRRFYEVYKTSPRKYVVAAKMKKAEMLLQHRKRPSEIYFELGYENQSSFTTEFKKHFGVTPTVYCQQY